MSIIGGRSSANPIVAMYRKLKARREMRMARMANTRVMFDAIGINFAVVFVIAGIVIASIWWGDEASNRYTAEGIRRYEKMQQRLELRNAQIVATGGARSSGNGKPE